MTGKLSLDYRIGGWIISGESMTFHARIRWRSSRRVPKHSTEEHIDHTPIPVKTNTAVDKSNSTNRRHANLKATGNGSSNGNDAFVTDCDMKKNPQKNEQFAVILSRPLRSQVATHEPATWWYTEHAERWKAGFNLITEYFAGVRLRALVRR
jgi:hypothetical protein